ncbi:protein of unknown function (plasmid) [Thermococcus nautili]|uniref:hypothetical protein n=1 Tax=Thermococcus nautili TaxID=195522 RepID=UPI0025565401|nr:hypothetical protein [Thermococcus nautili]CAI1494242.1 protein of unknown function [Thermococcus nautili]
MIGLKEIKPNDSIPQITISKDKTTIYVSKNARKVINSDYVRLFVDVVGDTIIIALQPSQTGYKLQKGGGIKVGKELKKLKLRKGQRNDHYLLIDVPGIGRLHAFIFGEIPEEYKKYAVNEDGTPVEAQPRIVEEPSPVENVETKVEIGSVDETPGLPDDIELEE